MKRHLIAVAAVLAAIAASPAWAQFYIGGAVGRSDINADPADWAFGPPFVSSIDDQDTGWKLFAGYRFSRHFGLELVYADHGRFTAVNTLPGVDTGVANVKVSSIAGFLTGTAPMTENFSFMGKIGFSSNKSDMTFSSGGVLFIPAANAEKTKGSFAWGLGAAYAFNKNVAVRVEYEDFGDAGQSNLLPGINTGRSQPHLLSVGAQFSF